MIALATGTDAQPDASKRRGQRNKKPYEVEAWRLEKKGDTIVKDTVEWTWCTKDHYSGGDKHNGMYVRHKTSEHDAWRKDLDDTRDQAHSKNSKEKGTTPAPTATTPSNAWAPAKKLGLSESLRTAMCTQAGMSADAADRIWTEACMDSGND